jgi:AbrB family looped-hinge helix DNA binding protein
MIMQLLMAEDKLKRLVGTLTERYQVTVPAEVRRHLSLGASDRVEFIIDDDGTVQLNRAEFSLETAFGSVTPLKPPVDIEEQIRIARDEKTERDFGGST